MWEIGFSNKKKWQPITGWDDIERELERLNDANHTHFDLSEDGRRYLRIYKGCENRVVVEYLNVGSNGIHEILRDPTQTTSVTIDYWAGWELPADMCVDKSLALRALRHFYEMQGPMWSLTWGPRPMLWKLRINQDAHPIRTWDQIEQAVDQMDNSAYAYLCLGFEYHDREKMEVYGGNQGRVHLLYREQDYIYDDSILILVDPTQTHPVTLYDGDERVQFGVLPPHYCVGKDLAKRALRHYFETRQLDDSLDWINQADEPTGVQGEPRIYP